MQENKQYRKQRYLKNRELFIAQSIERQKNNPDSHKKAMTKYRLSKGLGVYSLYNIRDNTIDYIGEGQLTSRKNDHKSNSDCLEVKNNIEKYGFDNIYKFNIIEKASNKIECEKLEIYWINKLQPRYNERKYTD
jgi:hypothetical protein